MPPPERPDPVWTFEGRVVPFRAEPQVSWVSNPVDRNAALPFRIRDVDYSAVESRIAQRFEGATVGLREAYGAAEVQDRLETLAQALIPPIEALQETMVDFARAAAKIANFGAAYGSDPVLRPTYWWTLMNDPFCQID